MVALILGATHSPTTSEAAMKPQTFTFTNVAVVHWENPPGAINSVAFDCATSPGVIKARYNTNKQAWDQVSFDGKTYPIKGIFQVIGCS